MHFANKNEIHVYGALFIIDTESEKSDFKTLMQAAREFDRDHIHIHLHDAAALPSPVIGQLVILHQMEHLKITLHLYKESGAKLLEDLGLTEMFEIIRHR